MPSSNRTPAPPADLLSDGDETQLLCVAHDGADTVGYIAIDSTVAGRARGGLRLMPDVSESEVRGLARAMTLKYGFLGLPQGGGKAGVRGDPEAPEPERRARLAAFARLVAPILRSGAFTPETDMGTTAEDIRVMLAHAGASTESRRKGAERSGYYTALTVHAATREALRVVGRELRGATVAIEGFGSVGGALAALMAESGARIVAVSTSRGAVYDARGLDVSRLTALAASAGSALVGRYGGDVLDGRALVELPVDVLSPCARPDAVHAGNVARVSARVVVPGANNPVTPEAERALLARGVVSVPDFVANAGGVLGGTMAFAGVSDAGIRVLVAGKFAARVRRLLEAAASQQVLPREVAVPEALERMRQVQSAVRRPRFRPLSVGLELYRRGWIPSGVVAPLSIPYFRRLLG